MNQVQKAYIIYLNLREVMTSICEALDYFLKHMTLMGYLWARKFRISRAHKEYLRKSIPLDFDKEEIIQA